MDHELVEAARNRDREAYAALIRVRGDRLYALAQQILRDVDRAERARYFLLDGGDGSFMVIDIQAPDEAPWTAFIADAIAVVERFEFAR